MQGADSTLSLYRDWDYFTSMAQSLRTYLYEYQTIPTWNFLLCGGKPELANPQSWAFTWPSLFVYLLPPLAALLCLWLLLTVIGWLSMKRLLQDLGAPRLGAIFAASLYAFNGYFASRFSQGQVSFAFYHLVPLMSLCHLRLLRAFQRGESRVQLYFAAVLVSFAFFTAALPHALFYFYPALVLVLLSELVRLYRAGDKGVGGAFLRTLSAHGLGLWLAAYKLWPVISWQLTSPRKGVLGEHLIFGDVLANTLRFAFDYDDIAAMDFERQAWFPWEYNAYVGPGVWVALALAACLWARRRRRAAAPLSALAGLCLISACLGTNLALGNENPLSLAHVFAYLPVLNGIRSFARYQILLIFGLTAGLSLAVPYLLSALPSALIEGPRRRSLLLLLFAILCLPGIAEFVTLASTIRGERSADLAKIYDLPPLANSVPMLARLRSESHFPRPDQVYLLSAGYWVGACYEPLHAEPASLLPGPLTPLTEPPPTQLLAVRHGGLDFKFSPPPIDPVRIYLADAANLSYDPAQGITGGGVTTVRLQGENSAVLHIDRSVPADRQGAILSALGVLVTGLACWRLRRD